MTIEFRCAECDKLLRTGDGTSGKTVKCPQCGAVLTVPSPTTDAPAGGPPPMGPPPLPAAQVPPPGRHDAANPYQSPTASAGPGGEAASPGGIAPTPIDMGDVFRRSWAVFQDNLGICVLEGLAVTLLALALMIPVYLLSIPVISLVALTSRSAPVFVFSVFVAVMLIGVLAWAAVAWLVSGHMVFMLKLVRGQQAQIGDIFTGGRYCLTLLGAGVLCHLICSAGYLLCIVPGVILWLMFSQFAFLIVDGRVQGATDALRLSTEMTRGSKLMIFLVTLIAVLVCELIAVVTCGLGGLVTGPYLSVLLTVIYLRVTGQPTQAARGAG
ncbi:MAG: Com family DNA-binding transcriptional regulator [Pirellulales bacterium]|nr:Com family DNA-binding transcriptional regulator [Pirellulales bacterium]